MHISKSFLASVASLALAFSPMLAQNAFAQADAAAAAQASALSGSGVTATV